MAKVAGLKKQLEEKAAKKAHDRRYGFAKTDKQKEFLKNNPNVKTASEMEALIAKSKSADETQNRMSLPYATNVKFKKGGRVKKRRNTRRENRLEELGRVDAEKAYSRKGKRNLKDEKKRIVRELRSGGGKAGSRGAALRGFGKEIR
jgi:hypothetical protein|tara:strand:+ start:176 stop:616 length:441 start_codon:yes stop_codon:yes gene_type:complete